MQLIREQHRRGPYQEGPWPTARLKYKCVGLVTSSYCYLVTRVKEAEPGLLLRTHCYCTKDKTAVFLSVITAGTLDSFLVPGRDNGVAQ
ncbi:hypothetical protein ACSS6W_006922 [Trichoderma asperelloides]